MLIVPFIYQGVVKFCILNSKFRSKAFSLLSLLVNYAFNYKEQFNFEQITNDYVITFIPSDTLKQQKRGFNSAQLIANSLAKKLNLKVKNLLNKSKVVEPFEYKNKKQRYVSIKNAFTIKSKNLPKNILLVDDVITTGATLLEATKTLKKAGCKNVICFALCFKTLDNTNNYTI